MCFILIIVMSGIRLKFFGALMFILQQKIIRKLKLIQLSYPLKSLSVYKLITFIKAGDEYLSDFLIQSIIINLKMVKIVSIGFVLAGCMGLSQAALIEADFSYAEGSQQMRRMGSRTGESREFSDPFAQNQNRINQANPEHEPQYLGDGPIGERQTIHKQLYYFDASIGNYVLLAEGEFTDEQLYYIDDNGAYVALDHAPLWQFEDMVASQGVGQQGRQNRKKRDFNNSI